VDAVDGDVGDVVLTVGVCGVDSTQLEGRSVGAGGVTAMRGWQRQVGMVAHIEIKQAVAGRRGTRTRETVWCGTHELRRRPAYARLAGGGR